MAKGKGKTSNSVLTDEQVKGLMGIATISFKGKGAVPREKVAKLARQQVRGQREEYTRMRRRIRASRYLGKYANSDELTADDVEMVNAFISGKATTLSAEEFEEFSVS